MSEQQWHPSTWTVLSTGIVLLIAWLWLRNQRR
jgi:hypothetical protein